MNILYAVAVCLAQKIATFTEKMVHYYIQFF